MVDLGGQYSQLIARRVREARVYSELVSHRATADEVRRRNPAALILSGGPASVYADGAPHVDPAIFELGIPTLGICYGMQLMAQELGGRVDRSAGEFGKTELHAEESALFPDLPAEQTVWMSHRDTVVAPPDGRPRRRRLGARRRSPRSRTTRAASTGSSSTPRSCTRRTARRC